jgi:hypothetical protein
MSQTCSIIRTLKPMTLWVAHIRFVKSKLNLYNKDTIPFCLSGRILTNAPQWDFFPDEHSPITVHTWSGETSLAISLTTRSVYSFTKDVHSFVIDAGR